MWKGLILLSAFISEKKRILISRQNNHCILHTGYMLMWKGFHEVPDDLHRESVAYLHRSFTLHDDTIKESPSWSTVRYLHIWYATFLAPSPQLSPLGVRTQVSQKSHSAPHLDSCSLVQDCLEAWVKDIFMSGTHCHTNHLSSLFILF